MKPGRETERSPPPRGDAPAALEKRRQPGRIRAFVLAVCVHAAFFALIVFGVTWQSSPTAPLVAELWDKLPPVAKPAPPKPEPQPEPPKPEPKPEPEPEKKPEPPKPEPPKPDVKPEPPKPDPAIAEKARREKEKRERLEREKEEKRKAEEVAKKKREQEEAAKKKREQEEAAKKKQEDERKRREDEARKREVEKARAEAAARQRSEVDKYIEQIRSKIRGRANVPDSVVGNPEVQVRLRILPGGEVLEATITRSSGNRAYDSAIERAIRSASPLPVPPPESELFPQFRDLNLNIRHER